MTNLVKSLGKIHVRDICLLVILQVFRQVVYELNQLSLAGSAPSGSMLEWAQDIVLLSMTHNLAGYHMFHDLTADTGKGYWPVFLSFLESWCDVCSTRIIRTSPVASDFRKIRRRNCAMSSASS